MLSRKALVVVALLAAAATLWAVWPRGSTVNGGDAEVGLKSMIENMRYEMIKLRQEVESYRGKPTGQGQEETKKPVVGEPVDVAEAPKKEDDVKNKDEQRNATLNRDVKVVASDPTEPLSHKDCPNLPLNKLSSTKWVTPVVKICIYTARDDQWISGAIKKNNLWEAGFMAEILALLKADPEIQLVDLGSNIGEYTLMAAALGRHVLAVDMLPENIHMLQHSLHESGLGHLVTLVNNGLWSDHRTLTIKKYAGNVGGTALDVAAGPAPPGAAAAVTTVTMDDLLPLLKSKKVVVKMDIETAEIPSIRSATKFFTELDVRCVMMEWRGKNQDDAAFAKRFFEEHGFKASTRATNYVPFNIEPGVVRNSDGVFFIKT